MMKYELVCKSSEICSPENGDTGRDSSTDMLFLNAVGFVLHFGVSPSKNLMLVTHLGHQYKAFVFCWPSDQCKAYKIYLIKISIYNTM